MKKLRRILLALVLVVILVLVGGFLYIDKILRSTIETQATKSLKLNTTLNSAKLALMGGSVNLNKLHIGSPEKFSAPNMFEMGDLTVNVAYGQLTSEPVHIKRIDIKSPKFVLEQVDGKMNFKEVMDSLPPTDPKAKVMKVVIEELAVSDAVVELRLGKFAGLDFSKPIEIKVPSLVLSQVGNADGANNGTAIKDVVMQLATALAGKAGDSSGFPKELQGLLGSNLKDVAGKLGDQFKAQLSSQLTNMTKDFTKNLDGEVNKVLKNANLDKIIPGGDINKLIPGGDLNKMLDGGLNKLIPGGNKKTDKKSDKNTPTNPTSAAPDDKATTASDKVNPEQKKLVPDIDVSKIIPGVDQKIDTQKLVEDLFGKKKKKDTKKTPEQPKPETPSLQTPTPSNGD